ncbi:mechanosensitive ion channel family protein [Spirulina sp. 06S082]|uniref:mechanosensitive ion channel family protein n=1 Tax=Spirulina sp. 06S082 TaxID=3110248 RepID=UPI002B1FD403|nr:mechanosensitive ion channel family protein [Spirulina sp. 06S082]MEA5471785.1 mechanosensitive ion channel family protein [Spirulina sp. 06S082]
MDILVILQDWFQFDEETQKFLLQLGIQLGIFLIFVLLSILVGRYTPSFTTAIVRRVSPQQVADIYQNLIVPIEDLLRMAGTFILISVSAELLQDYRGLYNFLQFFFDLATIASIAWLVSRLFRQFILIYGINIVRQIGLEVDELLLVVETIANAFIGFFAVVAFAQSQNVNLFGLLAGLGIGGIAIAFAAQKTLEQLLGTIVIYLDRPYSPGEYIRVNLNIQAPDVFGRIESIGLRSTKMRLPAKNTLLIIPNSIMANKDIENISRGKKVMVLLYLDFPKILDEREQALVEQVVKDSTNTLFGIDPGSTRINVFKPEDKQGTRARVSFFILGSYQDSLDLRKRLLEIANEKISKELAEQKIAFIIQEPSIYVESPVTI